MGAQRRIVEIRTSGAFNLGDLRVLVEMCRSLPDNCDIELSTPTTMDQDSRLRDDDVVRVIGPLPELDQPDPSVATFGLTVGLACGHSAPPIIAAIGSCVLPVRHVGRHTDAHGAWWGVSE